MRLISASRRTDIPAFYSRWLLARLREGYCHVPNPYAGQVYRVGLTPDDVVALALFTRDPRPLQRHLPALLAEGYRVYAHVTVNGYPRVLEPRSPFLPKALRAVRALGDTLGPENVVWRYDPIVLNDELPPGWHVARFAGIAQALAGYAGECYVSFYDRYKKSERNMAAAGVAVDADDAARQLKLAAELRGIAEQHGIVVRACCESSLAPVGVAEGACLDRKRAARLRPELDLELKAAPTREGCGCCEATDIGVYGTCGFGCAYCYATETRADGLRRLREHDPGDTMLSRPEQFRGVRLDEVAVAPGEPRVRRKPDSLF